MNKIQMKCQSCQGTMEVDEGQSTLFCPYCGAKELIPESDAVKIEKVKAEANMEMERQRMAHEDEKEKNADIKEHRAKFAKNWFSIVILVFAVISLIATFMSFTDRHILAGLTAMVQTALFIFAWLVGMDYISKVKRGFYILFAILGFVLCIPFGTFTSMSEKAQETSEKYTWPESGLITMLDKPDSKYGSISEYSDSVSMSVYRISEEDYKKYVEKCKNRGFTVDSSESKHSYEAFTNEGYSLRLSYWDDDKKCNITLKKPEELKKIIWPSIGLANLVDEPKYTVYGEINIDETKLFMARFYVNSAEDFADYVKKCQDKGFSVDYSKSDNFYTAKDEDGNDLTLSYSDEFTDYLDITITAPDKKETADEKKGENKESSADASSTSSSDKKTEDNKKTEDVKKTEETSKTEEKQSDSSSNLVNGMRPEFKKAMDDYEAFYDEYCSFMTRYSQNPGDLTLLMDYAKMVDKLAKMDDSFSKWDDGTMNDAELAYYLQVQGRITQKLLSVY